MTDTVLKSSDIDIHLAEVQTDRARAIHHWVAGILICLFSCYYFVIESQTYDLYAYQNIHFIVTPKLFDFYKIEEDVDFYKIEEDVEGLNSFHFSMTQRFKRAPELIEYEYIPTFVTLLRIINKFTGNTIVSAKLLILPKLLIYLFGMYWLLYFFSKRVYLSLLVSLLSIIPRFVFMQEHWGIGPFFSTQPKDLIYSILPLVFLVFINCKNDLKSLCILFLAVGIVGNIHPPAAINLAFLFSFTQLLIQKKWPDKISYAVLPGVCVLTGLFPFLIDNVYKTVMDKGLLQADYRRLLALVQGIKSSSYSNLWLVSKPNIVDVSEGYISIKKCLFAIARPIFSLNTLAFLFPWGFYWYQREFKDKGTKRIIKIQLIYLGFFCILGYIYAVAGFGAGGYLAYLGRSNTFIYLYIFIFLAFWVRWVFELAERLVSSTISRNKKVRVVTIYAVQSLITVLIILLVYPPINFKPNKHFPEYNFPSQFKSIKDFISKGIQSGAVDREFTEMANYVANSDTFSKESTFLLRNYAAFIILNRMSTYELPPALAGYNDIHALYEKVSSQVPQSRFGNYLKESIFGDISYEQTCQEFTSEIENYMRQYPVDYAILHIRYLPYLSNKLVVLWSNDKYMICQNSHIEGG